MKWNCFVVICLLFVKPIFAQQLDNFFFEKNQEEYSINGITNYYYEQGYNSENVDDFAIKNSKILKERKYYLYIMNELTRVKFMKNAGKIKDALNLLDTLKSNPYLVDNRKLSACYSASIGNVYFHMNRPSKAKKYYLEAITQFREIKDSVSWKAILINAGNSYAATNDPDSAFEYYKRAWWLDSLGVKENHLGLIHNLALYYEDQNKIDLAIEMYNEVRDLAILNDSDYGQMISSINLGNCYLELKNVEKALLILNEGKQIAIDCGMNIHILDFNRSISMCHAAMGEYSLAYKMLQAADSAERVENNKNLEDFTEKITLKHQNEIHQKEQFISNQSINKKKSEQRLFVMFLIITLMLTLLALYLYVQKNKKNKILARQNYKLVEQYLTPKTNKTDEKQVSQELILKIKSVLSDEKIFRDTELSLEKMAKMLETNRTYLSENINAHFGYSFRVLLNKYRIDDARRMLISTEYSHYSIEGIAISVGYRNISSFNVTFKKESGITPSYFRKKNCSFDKT